MPERRTRRAGATRGAGKRAAVETASKIAREIRRQQLRPGTKLESEQKMVERLGVARATVREALRLLEVQGALRMKTGAGGGPVVDVPGPEHLASVLSLQLQFAEASFRSVLDARRAIYPTLAAKAAEHATHTQIHAMKRSVERMHTVLDDVEALKQEIRGFHQLVADASGNTVLGLIVSALHRLSERAPVEIDEKQRREAVAATERELDAIQRGEPEQARLVTERSMAAALRYLEKTSPAALAQPVAWLVSGD